MTFKDIRWQIWRRAQIWKHARRDEELYNHLVASLFTSQSSLNSAHLMGTLIAVAGYGLTSDHGFLILAFITLVSGIARTLLFHSFVRNKEKLTKRADNAFYDLYFCFFSICFSTAFGLTCYKLIQYPAATGTHAIAAGAAVGYAMGLVARNAGRPVIVITQVLLIIFPMIFGFAQMHSAYGNTAVFLLTGTIISTACVNVSLHKNVIAVYNANKATQHMAMYDKLTGLMNRYTFVERVQQGIANNAHAAFAILYLDLDRFKEINDTLGHTAGDAVIIEVARRLRSITRERDIIARFGGDEFLIRLAEAEPDEIEQIVTRILSTLALPLTVDGKSFTPSASIGVALYPGNGPNADDVIKKADISLYEAKRAGGRTFRIFDPMMERELHTQRVLRNEIQLAVRQHEFVLYYQPIYDLGSHQITSVEALLRWNHPTRGLLPPGAFISIAEETMAIVEIGEQVIDAACEMAAKLPDHISVAVNLSTVQFHEPKRLVGTIKNVLQKSGLAASRLNLEITESFLMVNTPSLRTTLDILTDMGAKLVLDDFGTGYSSLSYIQDFPFSKIKVDKRFTDSLCVNAASPSIIRAITQIARELSLEIVVEGIETSEQESFVRMLGPTQGQGYLFCKPISGPELLGRVFCEETRGASFDRINLAS